MNRPVPDLTIAKTEQIIGFGRPNVAVLFGNESREDFETIKIAEVVRVADAPGAVAQPRRLHLARQRLAVRRGCRVDGQALGVADVGQMRVQGEGIDELGPGFLAALDAEDDHRAEALREVL